MSDSSLKVATRSKIVADAGRHSVYSAGFLELMDPEALMAQRRSEEMTGGEGVPDVELMCSAE